MAASSLWRATKAEDGRTYYYNAETHQVQWEKPAEANGDVETSAPAAPRSGEGNTWREVFDKNRGKPYYYNLSTKAVTWNKPEGAEILPAQAQLPPTPTKAAPAAFVSGGANAPMPNFQREERRQTDQPNRSYDRPNYGQEGYRQVINQDGPAMAIQDAEAAFTKLLKTAGVKPEWTWEQAMKAIITDPAYRYIADPRDRRAAFEKWVVETRTHDKEREKDRIAKLKDDFTKMLKSHPEIKHHTRWRTARPYIEGETIYKSTSDMTERKQLFEEYIIGLKKAHVEAEAAKHKSALDQIQYLLKSLTFEPFTSWTDARGLIEENETFKHDDKFRSLTKSDVLTAFQEHIKALQREAQDRKSKEKMREIRIERQNRDNYAALMLEMRQQGKLRAGMTWKDFVPLVEGEPRYEALIGQKGSNNIEFFWDALEDEERGYRMKRNQVLDVLDDIEFELTPQTTLEEFTKVMKEEERTNEITDQDLELVYKRLHDKIIKREEADKATAAKQARRAIDALRSCIKHLSPPVKSDDDWESVKARIAKYDEYKALESEEHRKTAYDKVIRRLKEKEADAEAFEREKAIRRAEREREDRYSRYGRGGRYSQTPELDPYEAERKKASAMRERQHRKSSGTGLSPTRHRDDRYERHRHDRERERDRGGYHDYDREYRDRERSYRSRLSDVAVELDYGESGRAGSSISTSGRRRRESEEDAELSTRRDSKRLKRDDDEDVEMKEMREEAEKKAKEEENLKSGSEEGEIEEV